MQLFWLHCGAVSSKKNGKKCFHHTKSRANLKTVPPLSSEEPSEENGASVEPKQLYTEDKLAPLFHSFFIENSTTLQSGIKTVPE